MLVPVKLVPVGLYQYAHNRHPIFSVFYHIRSFFSFLAAFLTLNYYGQRYISFLNKTLLSIHIHTCMYSNRKMHYVKGYVL